MKRILMYVFAGALLLLSAADASAKKKEIAIVAHRGYWNCEESGLAKNSLAALKQAQKLGFWGSEFDVNMTADGKLLVFHDGSVEGKSIEKNPASAFAYYRLKNGEPIPTLDQYLEQAKKSPKTMLVYELKKHSCPEAEIKAVELSIEKLKEHGLFDPDKVMFISFSRLICEKFAELAPGFMVQYLADDVDPAKLKADGINGIDSRAGLLMRKPQIYKEARENGMTVNTWTLIKEEHMRTMIEMGVDQITTDNPELLRKVLKDMGVKEKKAK